MEKQLVVLRGLPSSGKTTYARKWVEENPEWRVRVSWNDIADALYGKHRSLSRMQKEAVSTIEHATSTAALKAGLSVIIDHYNLKAQTVKDWISAADKHKVELKIVSIDPPIEELLIHNECRDVPVDEDEIFDMYQKYFRKHKFPPVPEIPADEAAVPDAKYEHTDGLPGIYLFDIDGTLAKMFGRSPFAWHRVGEDKVVPEVAHVADQLADNHDLIVFTGRDEVCRPETEEWLNRHGIRFKELHMRPKDTQHADDVMKLELFEQHVRGKYNVLGVFDDRLRVCRMWENLGLTLFRVGPIDADF